MGMRAPDFKLWHEGTLPANAGLVTETYGSVDVKVSCAGREIRTKGVWYGRLSGDSAASGYAVLRPTTGDWPLGTLIVAASCGRYYDDAQQLRERVLQESVTVGPRVEGTPPTCEFVSAPMTIHFWGHPGTGSRPPSAGVAFAGIDDSHGPIVSIEVEYTIKGSSHVCRAQDIARSRAGGGAVEIQGGADVDEIKCVRITNVLGKTLVILPPFPQGTAPAGPLGMKL
jgi:hypothetical protein